jgi:hypothetical protein
VNIRPGHPNKLARHVNVYRQSGATVIEQFLAEVSQVEAQTETLISASCLVDWQAADEVIICTSQARNAAEIEERRLTDGDGPILLETFDAAREAMHAAFTHLDERRSWLAFQTGECETPNCPIGDNIRSMVEPWQETFARQLIALAHALATPYAQVPWGSRGYRLRFSGERDGTQLCGAVERAGDGSAGSEKQFFVLRAPAPRGVPEFVLRHQGLVQSIGAFFHLVDDVEVGASSVDDAWLIRGDARFLKAYLTRPRVTHWLAAFAKTEGMWFRGDRGYLEVGCTDFSTLRTGLLRTGWEGLPVLVDELLKPAG